MWVNSAAHRFRLFWGDVKYAIIKNEYAQWEGSESGRKTLLRKKITFFGGLIYFFHRLELLQEQFFRGGSKRKLSLELTPCYAREDRQNGTEITEKLKLPNGRTAEWLGVDEFVYVILEMEWKSNLAWHSKDGKYCMKLSGEKLHERESRRFFAAQPPPSSSSSTTFFVFFHFCTLHVSYLCWDKISFLNLSTLRILHICSLSLHSCLHAISPCFCRCALFNSRLTTYETFCFWESAFYPIVKRIVSEINWKNKCNPSWLKNESSKLYNFNGKVVSCNGKYCVCACARIAKTESGIARRSLSAR